MHPNPRQPHYRAKIAWLATWTLLYILLCLLIGLLSSCTHRTASHIERTTTTDTLIIHRTDTLHLRDTLAAISKTETTDSITDRTHTLVVVDTAGRVIKEYIYRDRQTYHNRNALSTDHHSTDRTQKQQTNERQTTATTSESQKIEQPPNTLLSKIKALIAYAFIIALIAFIYNYIYKKK